MDFMGGGFDEVMVKLLYVSLIINRNDLKSGSLLVERNKFAAVANC